MLEDPTCLQRSVQRKHQPHADLLLREAALGKTRAADDHVVNPGVDVKEIIPAGTIAEQGLDCVGAGIEQFDLSTGDARSRGIAHKTCDRRAGPNSIEGREESAKAVAVSAGLEYG